MSAPRLHLVWAAPPVRSATLSRIFRLSWLDLNRWQFPARGILYSLLSHKLFLAALLGLMSLPPPKLLQQAPAWEKPVPLPAASAVLYLPATLPLPTKQAMPKTPPRIPPRAAPALTPPEAPGIVLPGPQFLHSNPPKPDNALQTIWQGRLAAPAPLKRFVAAPNRVEIARDLEVPLPKLADAKALLEDHGRPRRPDAVPENAAVSRPKLGLVAQAKRAEIEPPQLALSLGELSRLPLEPAKPQPPLPQQSIARPSQRREAARPADHGEDERNLLILSPVSSADPLPVTLPAGVSHGRFAVAPHPLREPAFENPGTANPAATAAVAEAAAAPPAVSVSASVPVAPPPPAAGARRNPLGITIQGGTLDPAPAAHVSLAEQAAPRVPQRYNLTIVSTASSGGGLPDFGVFVNQQVFTVYVGMQDSGGVTHAWVLQCGLAPEAADAARTGAGVPSSSGLSGFVPPVTILKSAPRWSAGLLDRYRGRRIVVSGYLDVSGRLSRLRVLQSPNPELAPVLLAALGEWEFRPAENDGRSVAVKVLLGVPVHDPP